MDLPARVDCRAPRLLQRDPSPLHPDVIDALELLASDLPELERQPLVERMATIIEAAGAAR